MESKGQWKAVVSMFGANFALGMTNALIKKTLNGGTNPMVIASYRLAISTLFLAPIAYFCEKKTRPKLTFRILCETFVSALLGASLTQYFLLLGLSYTSVTISCAFLSMVPAITFILALVFRLERANIKSMGGQAKVLGTIICIGGGLLMVMYKGVSLTPNLHPHEQQPQLVNHSNKKTETRVIGSLMLLTGCIFWSSWLLVQAKISKNYPCQYSSTVLLSFFGTIQSALLSLIKQRSIAMWVLKGKFEILTILFAGIVGQGFCTVGITWCIQIKGPVFTSAFTPVMLIIAALFDFTLLHTPLHLGSVLGSVILIIGLYIFLWGKSKEPNSSDTKQVQLNGTENVLPVSVATEKSANQT